jgi:hypothetical protein
MHEASCNLTTTFSKGKPQLSQAKISQNDKYFKDKQRRLCCVNILPFRASYFTLW